MILDMINTKVYQGLYGFSVSLIVMRSTFCFDLLYLELEATHTPTKVGDKYGFLKWKKTLFKNF